MAKHGKFSNKFIADTFQKKGANVTATCAALGGISRTTFYRWRNGDDALNEKLTDIEEALIDFTESKLIEQISDGNMTAIIFHLKTKGRNRGWVEKTEIEQHTTTDIDLSSLSDEELDLLNKLLSKANESKQ